MPKRKYVQWNIYILDILKSMLGGEVDILMLGVRQKNDDRYGHKLRLKKTILF
jgi:hypothetical protein